MEKQKHILSMLLLIATCLFSNNAFAYDALIDGIYYNFNGDEAEVTYNYSKKYTGDIVIPESVVYNAKTYSVTSIGHYAFEGCSGLTSVNIPNSITSIGYAAFIDCSGLTTINVEVGNIVYDSRNNCNAIIETATNTLIQGCKNTTIPNSVTSIGSDAFNNCSGLTSVTIPNSVTSIGNYAFSGCSGLTSITIGNSVTSIGYAAFAYCSGLTSVTIPNSVTSIGDYAFRGCSGLTSVTIGNSVTSIGRSAFYDCSALTSVTIPNSATSIGDYAFYGCSGLTSVTIPNSVTSIGRSAFYNCSALTSVTIPNSVTSIGDYAFRGCSGLTSVTIGNSVTSIGYAAFYGCSGLTSVTIPNSVTSIGEAAFYGCSGLTSVTIPNSVTSIGGYAFYGCSGLTSVTIGNSVTSIGYAAFYGCSGLTSVTIPNSVKSIGDYAFEDCSGLTSVTIGNSVTSIGYAAFAVCSGLTSVTIPNSVTSIGDYAFYNCSGLTSVTLNSNAIASKKYTSSSSLENVFGQQVNTYVIGEDVTSIGEYAFHGCSGLISVTIPNSVTSIGDYAFAGCMLENILLKSNIPPTLIKDGFTNQTYYHGMLYVPTDCWKTYAYDDNWYLFHNIRETATEEEQVTMQQAYTLMDANTFTYSVYDPVNNGIGTISSVGINEDNPNHSWQVITDGSKQYLYNLGAKKFATNGADGRLVLTAEPTPIDMENGDNGIVLGTQFARQWALVGNDRLSVEQDIITGIDEITSTQQGESISYDLQGRRIDKAQKGINIIRNADGTTKKVLFK